MRLPVPTTSSIDLVTAVVAERANGKNANFFKDLEEEWRNRVDIYVNHRGSAQIVHTWPEIEEQKKSFLNLYLSPQDPSAQLPVLQGLKAHNLNHCPACGEWGKPNTLDHYLPKSLYPHFCITPHNLFPMCDSCQEEKGTKVGNTTLSNFFIHPYFDTFVEDQVIRLDILPPYDSAGFNLGPMSGLSNEYSALVQSHLNELHIPERYAHFFRGQYPHLLKSVAVMRSKGQNIEESLINFQTLYSMETRNAWEHIFYSSVLSNPDLLDYLRGGALPSHI